MSEMDRDEALRLSIRDRVLRRAATDEDFRRLLMDNPKSAIARELGIDVPDGVHVTVLPETPNQVFVVLPTGPGHPQLPIMTGVERLAAGTGHFEYVASIQYGNLDALPAYGGGGGNSGMTMRHVVPAYGGMSNPMHPGTPVDPGNPGGEPSTPGNPGGPGGPRGPSTNDR